jgi:peptidoglycan hydrolase CwlO-like protein
MEIQKLIDLIPAVLLLISIMVIILTFGNRFFESDYKTDNALIFVALFLFILVLITHLFRQQTWTPDTLKIIIGVLIGAGSSKLSKTKKEDEKANNLGLNNNNIKDSIINQALGDINQKIENFKSEVSKIEHAIVNQYPTIEQKLDQLNQVSLQTQIKRPERFRLETEDEFFLDKLRSIPQSDINWTWKWREECIKYPEFHERIKDKIKELKGEGWSVISMDVDNTSNGIHINFEVEKPFE